MKPIEEIKKYLLENRVDDDGDLDLEDLDFSDFEGNVTISGMKVRRDLYQCWQTVQGNLNQDSQEVKGDLYQSRQMVQGNLSQSLQTVLGDLSNIYNEYGGELLEFPSVKTLKEITYEELFRMGYKIKEDYD